jgi:hypothetical protein
MTIQDIVIKIFFISTFLLYGLKTWSKVLIITHSYNRPDFIIIQEKTFKKFMKDEYEFIVFSDAADEEMNNEIINTCAQCNIICIRVPQEIHNRPYLAREPGDPLNRPNIRHANVVQYSMDILGFYHNGPVMILDSDMFLIRPFTIVKQLEEWDIISAMRGADNDVTYLWPGLMIFSMDKLPNKKYMNFNCGIAHGAIVDSGGHSYYYLKNNPTVKLKVIDELFGCQLFCPDRFAPDHLIDKITPPEQHITKLKEMGFNEKEITFLQKKPHTIHFLFNQHFLHYRAGSNYDNQSTSFEQHKMKLINEFLDDILNYSC